MASSKSLPIKWLRYPSLANSSAKVDSDNGIPWGLHGPMFLCWSPKCVTYFPRIINAYKNVNIPSITCRARGRRYNCECWAKKMILHKTPISINNRWIKIQHSRIIKLIIMGIGEVVMFWCYILTQIIDSAGICHNAHFWQHLCLGQNRCQE